MLSPYRRLRVAHFKSLHLHDAVAVACKRVPGGHDADDQPLALT
ncbi:MAG: hypothetical protein ACYCOY_02955 [Metallibacterium sp.]